MSGSTMDTSGSGLGGTTAGTTGSDMTGAGSGTTGASGRVETDETRDLIASDKVEGTAVYNRSGERLGTVHNFMVDKRSGQVSYAVMSFGGFLGIGEGYHPLPWGVLTYDTALGGYVVDLTREQLQGAPSYTSGAVPDWTDHSYGRRLDDYYGVRVGAGPGASPFGL